MTSHTATFMYMSKTVGVAELRQNLSVYLRRVSQGERLVVTAGVPFDMPGTTNLLKIEAV